MGGQVLLGAAAWPKLGAGIDLMAEVVCRTLGPDAGHTLSLSTTGSPEFLHDAGTLARRLIEVPGRAENVGAMLLRHAAWRTYERVGDGAATTAALVHSLVRGGHRLTTAGVDALGLHRGMRRALAAVLESLDAVTRPVERDGLLHPLVRTAIQDAEVARVVGEVFEELGPLAAVDVEEHTGNRMRRRVLPGGRWPAALVSADFATPVRSESQVVPATGTQTVVQEPYILLTDRAVAEATQILPLLDRLLAEDGGPLLIVAADVTDSARAALSSARARGLLEVVAVRLTGGSDFSTELADIAALTRATVFREACGDMLERAQVNDLGYAKAGSVSRTALHLVEGAGEPEVVLERRRAAQAALGRAGVDEDRTGLRRRIGNLASARAVVEVGASTDTEHEARVQAVERGVRIAQMGLETGAVPGGGAALLHCQPALDRLDAADEAEALGIDVVHTSLAAPMRWLVRNTGHRDPASVLAAVRDRGPGFGYHAGRDVVTDMWEHGIVDAAGAVRAATKVAIGVAGSVLETSAVVLRDAPAESITP